MTYGVIKANDLGPLSRGRLRELEQTRDHQAKVLAKLLAPKNKLGRWSPHYLPALQKLYQIEMQIDGFCFAQDVDMSSLPGLLEKVDDAA